MSSETSGEDYIMWLVILLSSLIVALLAGFFLATRISRFKSIKRLAGTMGLSPLPVSLFLLIAVVVVSVLILGSMNTIIVVIHMALIWGICDLIACLIGKIIPGGHSSTLYFAGYIALAITLVYFICGYYLAHHVVRTDYHITGPEPLTIAQIADSHVGTTMNGDKFAEYMQKINEAGPDIMVVTGDMIDDSTSKEDMIKACSALGGISTKYGTYFCWGNHDKGYGSGKRGYTAEEFQKELEKNGIIILEDEWTNIGSDYVLIGRADKGVNTRKPISELVSEVSSQNGDGSRYIIVLDHQPSDYDREAEAGCNLVLSGHTHGGQLIPILKVGEWTHANDARYGYERRNNTDFIVTSGIGDWEILFKTGCKSEYNVIEIGE